MKKYVIIFLLLASFPLFPIEQEKPQELQNREFLKSLGSDVFKGGVALSYSVISYLLASEFIKRAMDEHTHILENPLHDNYRSQDQDGAIRINTTNMNPFQIITLEEERILWLGDRLIPCIKKASIPAVLYILSSTIAIWYGCKSIYTVIIHPMKQKKSKIKSDSIKGIIALTATLASAYRLIKFRNEFNERNERIDHDPRFVGGDQGEADIHRLTNAPRSIQLEYRIKGDDFLANYFLPTATRHITPAIVAIAGTAATLWYGSKIGYELIKENKSKQNNLDNNAD